MVALKAIWWFLLLDFPLQVFCVSSKVPAIIVFGDSSVDAGNNNHILTILKSNFAPYGRDFNGGLATGRFSNGRLSTDFISEAFGIKPLVPAYLDPTYNITDFTTGVCFASAGTGYDNITSEVLSVIPLWKEMEYYKEFQEKLRKHLGNDEANKTLGEALYLISAGTNDFLENYYMMSKRSSKYSVEEYQKLLLELAEDFIRELYQLGAKKISISGLPPMGCLPLERTKNIFHGSDCIQEYNDVADKFNDMLGGLVAKMNKELVGIQAVMSNPYGVLSDIIHDPDSFGFDDVATACCGTGLFEMSYMCDKLNPFTCADASRYMFWDAFHPTEKTNKIVADHVVRHYLSRFL